MLKALGLGLAAVFAVQRLKGRSGTAAPTQSGSQAVSSQSLDSKYATAVTRFSIPDAPAASQLPDPLKAMVAQLGQPGVDNQAVLGQIENYASGAAQVGALTPGMVAWLNNALTHAVVGALGLVPIVGGLAGTGLQAAIKSGATGTLGQTRYAVAGSATAQMNAELANPPKATTQKVGGDCYKIYRHPDAPIGEPRETRVKVPC